MSKEQFKPAWWLKNSHLQTLWPVFLKPSIKNLPITRERIELPDGDFIDLDWVNTTNQGPIVIMLHGLEGSIESHYAKGMLKEIMAQGWRGVFMHFRGCSGEVNRLPRSYHSGETGDVAFIVKLLKQREPDAQLACIGYSLGGNVLLKWLGETGSNNPLSAAIAISVPFELEKAAQRIQQGFSRFYHWYFIKCLQERLTSKCQRGLLPLKLEMLNEISNIFEFDNQITAPLHGFKNAYDYYAKASSRQYLRHIEVPTLIVHAKDDPFMSADVIPQPDELSDQVHLEVSEYGGHVGFVGGKLPWRPEYWLEQRVPKFLAAHLPHAEVETE